LHVGALPGRVVGRGRLSGDRDQVTMMNVLYELANLARAGTPPRSGDSQTSEQTIENVGGTFWSGPPL
jgi:hypothetical protein